MMRRAQTKSRTKYVSNSKRSVSLSLIGAAACLVALGAIAQTAGITFRNTITGEVLNFDDALPEGRTPRASRSSWQSGIESL